MTTSSQTTLKCIVLLSLTLLTAACGYSESIPMGETMELAYSVPAGWVYQRDYENVKMTKAGVHLEFSLSRINTETKPNTQDEINTTLESMSEVFLEESVEKKANIVPLKNTLGGYTSFTDASLVGKPDTPGNFKNATVGIMLYGDYIVSFALMSNSLDSKAFKEAISFLTSMKYQTVAEGPTIIDIPGEKWRLSFQAPSGSVVTSEQTKQGYTYSSSNRSGFNLSIFVESKKNQSTGNQACADYYWPLAKQNPQIDPSTIVMKKEKNFVMVSYRIRGEERGMKIDMPNINLYFEYNGKWIDVHISKFPFQPSDQELLDTFVESLKYEPIPTAGTST